MSVVDHILAVLTPYECLGCSAEGDLLCGQCARELSVVPERCYRCLEPSAGALTCPDCRTASDLYRVRAGAAYSAQAKELVLRLKFSGAKAAARIMAARLAPLLPDEPGALVVPVPTAASRVRGRGYDQARLLARELSRQARLPYLDCLARHGHSRQVGMSRRQRLSQLDGAFRVKNPGQVRGRRILLIDDVVTTGATLEAAAQAFHGAGAGRIEAATFCAA